MLKINPKLTGERFLPHKSNLTEVAVNIERYLYALHHCEDKTVLDLGCGSGLGTYLYSLIAKKVIAVDYNVETLNYVREYPFEEEKLATLLVDLENPDQCKRLLPEVDVCIALEVLEHLEDPLELLKNLKAEALVFSIPLSSLANSKWHKYKIRGGSEGLNDIRELVSEYYDVEEYHDQYGRWVFGYGIRKC